MMKVAGLILESFSQENDAVESFSNSILKIFEHLDIVPIKEPIKNTSDFLLKIYAASKDYDYVVLAQSESPFYCEKENKILLDKILTYRADYGFSDNHPKGVIFEILKTKALPIMHNMREKYDLPIGKDIFQKIVEKDINMFDLENLYAKTSLRTLRLSFFQDNEQDKEITLRLLESLKKDGISYNEKFYFEDLAKFILNHKILLKTRPKYFEIEIFRKGDGSSILSPYKKNDAQAPMNLEAFKTILKKIKTFSPSAVIGISGIEEPSENKDLIAMLKYASQEKVACILETNLEHFSDGDIEDLTNLDEKYFTLILLIDAIDEATYKQIRKTNAPLDLLLNRAGSLLLRKKETYVQVTKMDINFEHLNEFYRYFKKYTDKIIIQKYNPYLGELPERRFNPMKPLEPIDCWHLKRDFYIHPNADVVLCKQDIHAKNKLGNLVSEDIEQIFEKSLQKYRDYLDGKFDFCRQCDENYTYNF